MNWWENLLDSGGNLFSGAAEAVSGVFGAGLDALAAAVYTAVGEAVAAFVTMWMGIPTPELTGDAAAGPVGTPAADVATVLGWTKWVGLAVCLLSGIALAARLALAMRAGDGLAVVGRLNVVLGAVVLIGASVALVGGLVQSGPGTLAPIVATIQSGLWWLTVAGAVVSVIVGAARMAWEQRAQPGRELAAGMLRLILTVGMSTSLVAMLARIGDTFADWLIVQGAACSVDDDGACFGRAMTDLFVAAVTPGVASIALIVLGLLSLLASLVQSAAMIARTGMLPVMCGILPLSATATNTRFGRDWNVKIIGWTVAFVCYKPAAALVYFAAFRLIGQNAFGEGGIVQALAGLTFMVLSITMLPVLMKLFVPAVGALTSDSGGGGGGMMMASGAMMLSSRGSAGSSGASGAGYAGSSGSSGPAGPAGAGSGSPGPAKTGTGAAPPASGAGAASTAGAGGGAGAGASGASGAAAAAGPAGAAAAVGTKVVSDVAGAVKDGAAGAASNGTEVPDGSKQ